MKATEKQEFAVVLAYALTKSDILNDELGTMNLPLSKALEVAERMLRGRYVMVKIRKENMG